MIDQLRGGSVITHRSRCPKFDPWALLIYVEQLFFRCQKPSCATLEIDFVRFCNQGLDAFPKPKNDYRKKLKNVKKLRTERTSDNLHHRILNSEGFILSLALSCDCKYESEGSVSSYVYSNYGGFILISFISFRLGEVLRLYIFHRTWPKNPIVDPLGINH